MVGTLNFGLRATVQFSTRMYIDYCENHGSLTAKAGIFPTLTIKVSAGGDLEILVRSLCIKYATYMFFFLFGTDVKN